MLTIDQFYFDAVTCMIIKSIDKIVLQDDTLIAINQLSNEMVRKLFSLTLFLFYLLFGGGGYYIINNLYIYIDSVMQLK